MATPRFWPRVTAIAVAGWLGRVGFVLLYAPRRLPFGDGLEYHLLGDNLARGSRYIESIRTAYLAGARPTAQHPPLFPMLLSGVSRVVWFVGGPNVDTTRWHQLAAATVSAAAIAAIAALGRALAGPRVGLAAAVIAAVYPPLWVNDAVVMSETLLALTTALVLLAVYRMAGTPTWRRAVGLGVATGAMIVTRSETALLVATVVLPSVVLRRGVDRARRLALAGAVVAAAGVVVAPWIVRNLRTFDRPVLLSQNLDSVIAGANCPATYYGPQTGSWVIECNTENLPAGDESVQGAALRRRGLRYAGAHLGRVPVVVAARVGRLLEVYRPLDDQRGEGRRAAPEVLAIVTFYGVQLLAAVGAVRLHRLGVAVWPLVAVIASTIVVAAATYGLTRLRMPYDVATVPLAAAGIASIVRPASWCAPATPSRA